MNEERGKGWESIGGEMKEERGERWESIGDWEGNERGKERGVGEFRREKCERKGERDGKEGGGGLQIGGSKK